VNFSTQPLRRLTLSELAATIIFRESIYLGILIHKLDKKVFDELAFGFINIF
jgi:hypothetical protein